MGEQRTTRWHYLLGLGTAGAVGLAGCMAENRQAGGNEDSDDDESDGNTPESTAKPDFDGYLDDANNYDGTVVDAQGHSEVTISVGAGENGLAFGPAAVHVDPGATVVWQWTGRGGAHNVVAEDDTFDSGDPVAEQGRIFSYTFEEAGIYLYYCAPHKAIGMRGAVVVGDAG